MSEHRASATTDDLRAAIRDVPDFPRPGIIFKDITPLLADARLFRQSCEALAEPYRDSGVTHVAAIESRGFILGGPVAAILGAGFIPVRKTGKLPYQTERLEYALEYGTDALEVHVDACGGGAGRVLVVDDVLATGGTAAAACRLLESVGAEVVGCSFLIALSFLNGSDRVAGWPSAAAITF
jgi:adenine phosphoribosyltransferase